VKAKSVTVLARSDVPFKGPLGDAIGQAFLGLHQKNKINFLANTSVKQFFTENGKIVRATLSNGSDIPVSAVIAGVGVEIKSSTSIIKESSHVRLDKDGSIFTDEYLHAGNGLYAAGDVARFPSANGTARIEHWGVAQNQGKTAASNIAGKKVKYHHVPYFWTQQYGKSLRYAGNTSEGYDEIIYDKEANGLDSDVLKFAAFYVKGNQVLAVATLQRDPIASQVAELMHAGKMFDVKALKAAIDAKNLASLFQ
jgi:NADPH-dependent 2,4-dienoyl-CoA reductase/sulfur reductase-like enzyme